MAAVRTGKAAAIVGCSQRALRNWARAGHLRAGVAPDGEMRFDVAELRRFKREITGLVER